MKDYKLTIPEPCHEDWNKMSPTEQGRFCKLCSKNVVDFSNKSKPEIIETILASPGKVCGVISKKDLSQNELDIYIPLESIDTKLPFIKRFFIAALFVFGTALFVPKAGSAQKIGKVALTCNEKPEENIKGELVAVTEIDVRQIEKVTMQSEDTIPVSYIDTAEIEVLRGEPSIVETAIVDKDHELIRYALGGLVAIQASDVEMEDTTGSQIEEVTTITRTLGAVSVVCVEYIAGVEEETDKHLNDSLQVKSSPIIESENELIPVEKILFVHPNPARERVEIRIEINHESRVSLGIFNSQGIKIEELIPEGKHYPGIYIYPLELGQFPAGTYFVQLQSDRLRVSEKLIITK